MSAGSRLGSSSSAETQAVRQRELALLCRQLGTMLNAGTDILRALLIVQDQLITPALRAAMETARNDMTLGSTLALSLGRYPRLFSPFFVDMVRQGESEGTLGDVLFSLADYLEKEARADADGVLQPVPVAHSTFAMSGYRASPSRPESWFRFAIWFGAALAAAAAARGIGLACGVTAAGDAAGAFIFGISLAGWGFSELRIAGEVQFQDDKALEAPPSFEQPGSMEPTPVLRPTNNGSLSQLDFRYHRPQENQLQAGAPSSPQGNSNPASQAHTAGSTADKLAPEAGSRAGSTISASPSAPQQSSTPRPAHSRRPPPV